MPAPHVPATSQLVVELLVTNLDRAVAFYLDLGFAEVERHDRFVALAWEEHLFFLDERADLPPLAADAPTRANVRIMVPDVDAHWQQALARGVRVAAPIADRSYGLRDFTIVDPDGFGVRFATRLTE
jgi:catechol 2,3-dioxygenase-like lactoylglutathione lyase family enzyme